MVVDVGVRGQGVGPALVSARIDQTRDQGAVFISLNSRPDRTEANKIYQKLDSEAAGGDPGSS